MKNVIKKGVNNKMNQSNQSKEKGIYLGDRKDSFKTLIYKILKLGKISKEYLDLLTSPNNLELYGCAFTSELVDENNNYQPYEIIGDGTVGMFIVDYAFEKFPHLQNNDGIKIVARFKINYGSKENLSKLAEDLGMWEFISATNEQRLTSKKSLLEDVFESFLGVTTFILNKDVNKGVGYALVYRVLKGIYSKVEFSLKYEDLYDAKTRLKEVFDMAHDSLEATQLLYREEKMDSQSPVISKVFLEYKNKKQEQIGFGTGDTKMQAQQDASENAIKYLSDKKQIKKHVPAIYEKIQKQNVPYETIKEEAKRDVLRNLENDESKIDQLFSTRGKSKHHHVGYLSTLLASYCKKRNFAGMELCKELKANSNIRDSEDLTCGDLFVIGKKDEGELVKGFTILFNGPQKKLEIHKFIYEAYLKEFENNDNLKKFLKDIKQV